MDELRNASEEEPRGIPLLILFLVLYKMSTVVTMFISLEKEYWADAAAIRMTCNRVALALMALYKHDYCFNVCPDLTVSTPLIKNKSRS